MLVLENRSRSPALVELRRLRAEERALMEEDAREADRPNSKGERA